MAGRGMDNRLNSSCETREAISSELSRRLSLPLASIAARSWFSRSTAPIDDFLGALNGRIRLGRKLWKASDDEP